MQQLKFKLLIENPQLNTSAYSDFSSPYLQKILSAPLKLLTKQHKPVIFSCFVLSIDGKLCYPDLSNGLFLAKNNLHATSKEQLADWWILSLSRALSDAVIIGTNSLLIDSYQAEIDIPELKTFRQNLNKPNQLLHLIITRDCDKINLFTEKICVNPEIPLIIYTSKTPQHLPDNFCLAPDLTALNLVNKKQVVVDNELNLAKFFDRLFTVGIKVILNESPYYHHHLQQLQLLDEAWINTSTIYIGGNAVSLGITNQAFDSQKHPHYTILTMHNIGYNFFYSRYKINYN